MGDDGETLPKYRVVKGELIGNVVYYPQKLVEITSGMLWWKRSWKEYSYFLRLSLPPIYFFHEDQAISFCEHEQDGKFVVWSSK